MVLDAEHLGEDRGAVHAIERHGTKGGAFELAPKRREGARSPRLACHRFDRRGAEREVVERPVVADRLPAQVGVGLDPQQGGGDKRVIGDGVALCGGGVVLHQRGKARVAGAPDRRCRGTWRSAICTSFEGSSIRGPGHEVPRPSIWTAGDDSAKRLPRTMLSRPPPMNTGCCTRRKRLPSTVVPLAMSSR